MLDARQKHLFGESYEDAVNVLIEHFEDSSFNEKLFNTLSKFMEENEGILLERLRKQKGIVDKVEESKNAEEENENNENEKKELNKGESESTTQLDVNAGLKPRKGLNAKLKPLLKEHRLGGR